MKKSLLSLLVFPFLLVGCNFEVAKNQEPVDEQKEQQQDQEKEQEEQEKKENIDQEYTETIETSGVSFATAFSPGYHFDTDAHKEELAEYFYDQVEYENLITEVETDNLHSQKFDSVTYLQFGSGSIANGYIEWKSIEKIYKVEIEVLCYAKEDTYHGITNIDNWSHIAINSTDFDLTYDGKTNPTISKISLDFPDGVTSFKVSSSLGRVFMKDMTITWRG